MDDIMIWRLDTQSHLQTVKKVLGICKCNDMSLNKDSCQIAVQELTFLGNHFTTNDLQPDPTKVKLAIEFLTS